MALIRYPGSKEKLVPQIASLFPSETYGPLWVSSNGMEYREPFFGAGAVGFDLLMRWAPNSPIWLNDVDYGLVCLWQSVWKSPADLIDRVKKFEPSTDKYFEYKSMDGNFQGDIVSIGFRKLALHQMSYSGLGYKSGGPIGGASQNNDLYNVSCRWSVPNLIKNIGDCHKLFSSKSRLTISCKDFYDVLIGDAENIFIYLDPPYYEKGEQLYKHAFTDDDHARLASVLKSKKYTRWVLSYDDHPEIRRLYDWADFDVVNAVYSIYGGDRPKNREIVITPKYMSKNRLHRIIKRQSDPSQKALSDQQLGFVL